MIVLIDNGDTGVYNLARYVGRLGMARKIISNSTVSPDHIQALNPVALILSAGHGGDFGLCPEIIRQYAQDVPMLGIGLGMHCIGHHFHARTITAPEPVYGRTSRIVHNGKDLFMGLESPMIAARYHANLLDIPRNSTLKVTARTEDGLVMAIRHESLPIHGVQFSPESIMTEYGLDLIRNFIHLAQKSRTAHKKAA